MNNKKFYLKVQLCSESINSKQHRDATSLVLLFLLPSSNLDVNEKESVFQDLTELYVSLSSWNDCKLDLFFHICDFPLSNNVIFD